MFAGFVLATVISNVVYSLKCVYGWIPKCMMPQSVKDLKQDTAAVEKVRAKFNALKVEQHLPIPDKCTEELSQTTFENSAVHAEILGKQAVQMH